MPSSTLEIVENKNLNKHFEGVCAVLSPVLAEILGNYLCNSVEVKLLSLSHDRNDFINSQTCFVSQKKLGAKSSIFVRINEALTGAIITINLGSSAKKPNFKLNDITELEVSFITSLNKKIFDKLENSVSEDHSGHLTYACFCVSVDDFSYGHIILAFNGLKNIAEIAQLEEPLDIRLFEDGYTHAKIRAGSTKAKVDDLKSLQGEDIVVLDNSDITKMIADIMDRELEIKINPNPDIVIEPENGELEEENLETVKTDIWDSVEIEVSAEFDKIKMTLGELRQITDGLVVDLASLSGNTVFLNIENSPIAKGELVIVGDKYGVKITEVFKELKNKTQNEKLSLAQQNQEKSATAKDSLGDDLDIGEDDFDIDDEI